MNQKKQAVQEKQAALDPNDKEKAGQLNKDLDQLNKDLEDLKQQRESIVRGKQGGPQDW
jgi:hypothetical protein